MTWVHAVIDVPAEQHMRTAEFWENVTGWRLGTPWTDHPELRSFEPPSGAPYLHLQQIDGPPRVHMDIESEATDRTLERAIDLGAVFVDEHASWRTLRSPGGLPFCLIQADRHDPPRSDPLADGHRSRLVQVCIDSPSAVHDAEVAFWRALLPGRWVDSSSAEFAGKWHDDAGSPLQLLLQRLDETAGPTRAHLDLGTDDRRAEVDRLVELGAPTLGHGHGWNVLRDVAGLLFCVTDNAPVLARHRDLG